MADKLEYIHLIDGSLDLEDIALLNDAIDVQAENQRRFEESLKKDG